MPGRSAFFADIHGNAPALRAVLDDIQYAGCSQAFMLGDLVNGLDPGGCTRMLREWSMTSGLDLACIQGNAEAYLSTPRRDQLANQTEEWNQDMIELVDWFEKQLDEEDIHWLSALPSTLRWNDMLLVHDSPFDRRAVNNQAKPDIPPEHREWFYHGRGITEQQPQQYWDDLWATMQTENLRFVFCGHTHLPLIKRAGDRVVCNVGSAGMPLDGDPRACWVLLEEIPGQLAELSFRRVPYALDDQVTRIQNTPLYPDFKMPGYRQAYQKMFLTGIHWREQPDD